jgi:hypothetical protein
MKKVSFTLLLAVLCSITAWAQVVADFQTAEDYTLSSWGYANATVIGDDPADASNKVLIVEKDGDATFDQSTLIKLAAPVTVTDGNTKFAFKIKSSVAGVRPHIWIYSGGEQKVSKWAGGTIETADEWNVIETEDAGVATVDSFQISLGGWDNGNAPEGLQATYYIDDVEYIAPPSYPKVDARKVVDIYQRSDEITLDGFDMEDSWLDAEENEVSNVTTEGTSASFAGKYYSTWDDDYFYLFISVNDPTASVYDGADNWKKDGTQLYWDVRNHLLGGSIAANTQHQLTAPYGGTLDQIYVSNGYTAAYNDISNALYFDMASAETGSGYSMEMRIPWASMYYNADDVNTFELCLAAKTIAIGDTLGFDMQLNDYNAATDNREGTKNWSGTADDNPGTWQNSGVWGGLRLADATGVERNAVQSSLKVYPIPAISHLYVQMENIDHISIYDMLGRMQMTVEFEGATNSISVESLDAGVYILKAVDKAGLSTTQKFNKK